MKIRIVKKENPADVGVIDLSKAVAVHYDPKSRLLELYSSGVSLPAVYSEELHDFQLIEIAMSGSVHYSGKSAQQIVELYGVL